MQQKYTDEQINQIVSVVAKGWRQSYFLRQLFATGTLAFRSFAANATTNYNGNRKSFYNMLSRLADTGVKYQITLGKRGGMWSAKVVLL
jgi:hypothetical protein